MRFTSLFAKLSFIFLLLFCLVGTLVVSVTLFATEKYQQEVNQKLNRAIASHIVHDTPLLQDGHVNQAVLSDLFHSLMVFNPSLEIYLLDDQGGILAFSAPPWKVKRLSVSLQPIQRYLQELAVFPITGEDPRSFTQSKVFSAATISDNNGFEGYLYVILGGEEYDDAVQRVKNSYILKLSLLVLVLGLVFAALTGGFLVSGLIRRLRKLALAMEEFKKHAQLKTLDFPVMKGKGDEIDQLSAAFYEMARTITLQFDDLKSNDHLRRELVANVSHDLRTPLATLQGYIETLLMKDSSFDALERKQYLSTAIKHCHRLNQLITELFELAKLDSHGVKILREPFNLAELVQDIIQKFKLRAQKKGVVLETKIQLQKPFAVADISMIERVLENLLENSLRHTPANGIISVDLQESKGTIEVRVIDSGTGIPEAEIPFIFDRFYQLDKSRSSQDGGSGLGLAIVKRIIELHNAEISATSVPNRNTVFSFQLPAYQ